MRLTLAIIRRLQLPEVLDLFVWVVVIKQRFTQPAWPSAAER